MAHLMQMVFWGAMLLECTQFVGASTDAPMVGGAHPVAATVP